MATAQSKFKMPDITPAQITADIVALAGIGTTLGLKLNGDLQTNLTAAIIGVFAVINAVHKIVDAYIRGKRADNAEKLKP